MMKGGKTLAMDMMASNLKPDKEEILQTPTVELTEPDTVSATSGHDEDMVKSSQESIELAV